MNLTNMKRFYDREISFLTKEYNFLKKVDEIAQKKKIYLKQQTNIRAGDKVYIYTNNKLEEFIVEKTSGDINLMLDTNKGKVLLDYTSIYFVGVKKTKNKIYDRIAKTIIECKEKRKSLNEMVVATPNKIKVGTRLFNPGQKRSFKIKKIIKDYNGKNIYITDNRDYAFNYSLLKDYAMEK